MEKQIYMTPKQPFFVTSSRSYEKFILNRFGIVHFYHCFTGGRDATKCDLVILSPTLLAITCSYSK